MPRPKGKAAIKAPKVMKKASTKKQKFEDDELSVANSSATLCDLAGAGPSSFDVVAPAAPPVEDDYAARWYLDRPSEADLQIVSEEEEYLYSLVNGLPVLRSVLYLLKVQQRLDLDLVGHLSFDKLRVYRDISPSEEGGVRALISRCGSLSAGQRAGVSTMGNAFPILKLFGHSFFEHISWKQVSLFRCAVAACRPVFDVNRFFEGKPGDAEKVKLLPRLMLALGMLGAAQVSLAEEVFVNLSEAYAPGFILRGFEKHFRSHDFRGLNVLSSLGELNWKVHQESTKAADLESIKGSAPPKSKKTPAPTNALLVPTRKKCYEWLNTGSCSKGDQCRYAHINRAEVAGKKEGEEK